MKKPEMPNVRSRRNPKGKVVYFIDYWNPWENKRIRKTIGTRKTDAQRRASQVYDDMRNKWLGEDEIAPVEIGIADLVNKFISSKEGKRKDRTVIRYRIHASHLIRFFENKMPAVKNVQQVKRTHIEAHLHELFNAGQKPKTLNAQLRFIQSLFIFGKSQNYCRENPAEKIERYADNATAQAVKFWTKDEMTEILENVKGYYRDAYEFIYHTGLRKEELIYLTWDDVELENGAPVIKIQAKEYAPGRHWTPKSKQRRMIPLNKRAVEIIQNQQKSDTHNFVFRAPMGGQIHPDRFLETLKLGLKKIGLDGNVHKIRHTFASHLVMKGVGIETISKLLGHSSIEMTMKYAHLAPDHLHKAIDMLID